MKSRDTPKDTPARSRSAIIRPVWDLHRLYYIRMGAAQEGTQKP
jgi:hypothetical protein